VNAGTAGRYTSVYKPRKEVNAPGTLTARIGNGWGRRGGLESRPGGRYRRIGWRGGTNF